MEPVRKIEPFTKEGYTNRVADAVYFYAEQQAQLKISNPLTGANDPASIALTKQYYQSVYKAYKRGANPYEKHSLRFVKKEIARLNARLKPTILNRFIYSRIASAIGALINPYSTIYRKHREVIDDIEKQSIEAHNFQSLSTSIKKAGFKNSIDGPLQKLVRQGFDQFHIRYADVNSPTTDFTLHFRKIPNSDLYYFEKFDAISRPTLDSLIKNDPSCVRQTFYLNDRLNFTASEAAALVNNKPICKVIDENETWLSLQLQPGREQRHSFKTCRFDLTKELNKLPLKSMNQSQERLLLDTLKRGASKEITMVIDGQPVKYKIEASPFNNTVNVLNEYGALVNIQKILSGEQFKTAQKITKMSIVRNENPTEQLYHSKGRRV